MVIKSEVEKKIFKFVFFAIALMPFVYAFMIGTIVVN